VNILNHDNFRVDLLGPVIQTATTFVAAQALGSLGKYNVSNQTTVLVSSIATVFSSFAANIFNKNSSFSYIAIPVGMALGVVANNFFYPEVALNQVLDVKGAIVIAVVIAAVKFFSERVNIETDDSESPADGSSGVAVAPPKSGEKKSILASYDRGPSPTEF